MNGSRVRAVEPGRRFSFVETTFGTGLIEWTDDGIARVELPDATRPVPNPASATAARPAGFAADAAGRMQSYFAGEKVEFDGVPVDFTNVPGFAKRVYEATRLLRHGERATYGLIADRIGVPGAARAIGGALGRNPVPLIVPCHRVIAANGRMGGFSAGGGVELKRRMLALENAAALR